MTCLNRLPLAFSLVFLQSAYAGDFEDQLGRCENTVNGLKRLILKAKQPQTLQELNSIEWIKISELSSLNLMTIGIPFDEDDEAIARRLFETGNFERVSRDCVQSPSLVPNDAQWGSQSYLSTLGAPTAWDVSTGSSSVTIAILDSGVDAAHEDLSSLIVPGMNTVSCLPTAAPGCGVTTHVSVGGCGTHGTNVASIAGAVGNNTVGMAGVTWSSRIMPIRITNDAATCLSTTSEMAEGIVWASEQGAKVINVSYSGVYDPTIQDAASQARRNGSLVIFAAGNDGADLNTICTGVFGASICGDLTHSDVLIVGSVTSADALSAFSNYGSLLDMVAFGESIVVASATGGYTTGNGTSFAAPLVAGTAALLWAIKPTLNPLEVQHAILQSSLDLGTAGEDDTFGVGRLRIAQAVTMVTTSDPLTSYSDNRDLDLLIPKGPAKIGQSDQMIRGGATSRLMIFSETNPGLISLQEGDIARYDLTLSEMPRTTPAGRASIFYMKDDASADFVFTDKNRKYVYLGSTTAFGTTSENPIINSKACGPFSEISDIHLTENAAGVTSRLIVADKGADTVYSYVLDPDGSSLCTTALSASVTDPLWIRSVNGANPRIYIGSKDSTGLRIRAYQNSDLTPTSAIQTITTSATAGFSKPFIDTTSNELWVPVGLQNDSSGNDFLYRFNYAAYPPVSIPAYETCQSPAQILQDFEGASRLTYVMCPQEKVIEIYDTSYSLIGTIPLTFRPRKILVGSDGTNRYLALMRSDYKASVYKSAVATDPPAWTAAEVTLPAIMDDIGHFGALDYAVFVNSEKNLISYVDLNAQSLSYTNYLPRSIDAIVAQSALTSHFVSSSIDRAYTLEELQNGAWGLRTYSVGDFPLSILHRPNRLYTLNRDGATVSVINLATRAVTSVATQARPVSMVLNTTLDRLWTANDTGNSVTTISTAIGAEALVSHTALGFAPKKILHQSSDNTLYVMGTTSVRLLDGTSLATVRTQSFTNGVSDMALRTGGVWATSRNGVSATYLDRATTTATSLSYSPQQVTSNNSVGVVALQRAESVRNSAGYTWDVGPFHQIFSTASNLFVYNSDLDRLRIYPYSQMGATTFAGVSQSVDLDIDKWSSDSSGNLWLAQNSTLKVERFTSALQAERLKNVSTNFPTDLATNSTLNRLYVLLRNMNAVAVYDSANARTSFYSVCQSPSQMLLDSANSRILILCAELNTLEVLSLNSLGDISGRTLLATGLRPVDMAYNSTNNRIYVVNKLSDSVYVFDGSNLASAPTSVTVSDAPQGISWNSGNNMAYIFHDSPKTRTNLNGATSAATTTTLITNGYSRTETNSSTNSIWSISRSPGNVYSSLALQNYSSISSSIATTAVPYELAISPAQDKTYVTYPTADAIRIYDETNSDVTDVTVGDDPRFVYADDTAARIYVANYGADTVSVVSPTTDAVLSTVSLTSGCGPTRMRRLNISGTNYIFVLCSQNDSVEYFHATTYGVQTPISLRLP